MSDECVIDLTEKNSNNRCAPICVYNPKQKWEPIEEIATSCEHKYHILEESYDIDIRCERCGKCGGADEMNAQLNAYRQRIDELEGLLNAFHEVVHKAMGKRQEGSSDE